MTVVEFAGETHPGCVRSNNEDVIGWSLPAGVWLVADGLGGHASGEVASRIVKQTVLKAAGQPDWAPASALLKAHEAIVAARADSAEQANMGSTALLVQIADRCCRLAWCGDSRAYLWRGGKLARLTRDHSTLQGMIDAGDLSTTQAHGHALQNQLTQALGDGTPTPEESEVQLNSGDWLLMCTDGLHDTLNDRDIAAVLRASDSPDSCTQQLMQRALAADARDNVSVIAIRCPEYPDDPRGPAGSRLPRAWLLTTIGALLIAIFVYLLLSSAGT